MAVVDVARPEGDLLLDAVNGRNMRTDFDIVFFASCCGMGLMAGFELGSSFLHNGLY